MKYFILLALVAMAAAVDHHYDHGDPLHVMIHAEVRLIIASNPGITVDNCVAKCDAIFDLANNHYEHLTDHSCTHECRHQLGQHGGHHSTTAQPMDTTSA